MGKVLSALLVVVALVAAGLYAGYVQVEPDEKAIVLRLGRFNRSLEPGPAFFIPFIEKIERARVTIEREEFGYRAAADESSDEERPEERRMLTGDTNLVDVGFAGVWRITDLSEYRLRVKDVPGLIQSNAQAVMRAVVAGQTIDEILTTAKGPTETQTRQQMQAALDTYRAGVTIDAVELRRVLPPEEVREAFRDVTSAEQEKSRLILEAQAYAESVVPVAKGEAEAILNHARSYRERRVLASRGQADRFNSLLVEYQKAPGVTRERLYLETLEEILPGMEKIIIDSKHADRVLPYLPITPGQRVERVK